MASSRFDPWPQLFQPLRNAAKNVSRLGGWRAFLKPASDVLLIRKQEAVHPSMLLRRAKAADRAGNYSGAAIILDALADYARQDGNVRCFRARVALKLNDLEGARKSAREASLLQPRKREPWVLLALVAERECPDGEAMRAWTGAADRADLSSLLSTQWSRLRTRKPRRPIRLKPLKRRVPVPEDWGGFIAHASVEQVTMLAEDLVRVKDLKPLFALLDTFQPAPQDVSHFQVLRRYCNARLLFHHQCFEEAAQQCGHLLSDPTAVQFLGTGGASRRVEIMSIEARSFSILGRRQERPHQTPISATDSKDLLALELDISWRSNPPRALQIASALMLRDDPPSRVDTLFSYIPLTTGNPQEAKANLKIAILRKNESKKLIDPELALCGALLCSVDVDAGAQLEFFRYYFNYHEIEFPQTDLSERFSFNKLNLICDPVDPGPLVTLIMTAFNAAATIDCALVSVLNQSYSNLEIIVIDDHSTDDTWAKITSYADRDSRIVALRNTQNVGTHECKNIALSGARGEYYTCHDSDDWCHPRRIEYHVSCMEENDDLVASASNWFRMDESGRPVIRPWQGKFTHLNPASTFCRMHVRDDIGFYDRIRIEADLEHWLRLAVRYGANRIARLDAPLAIGRSRAASLTRSGIGAQNEEGYSATRSRYRFEALKWRRRMSLEGDLYLPYPMHHRPFPAPPEIVVDTTAEQDRYLPGRLDTPGSRVHGF